MIRLGGFEVHEPVGRGATGVVWRASHDGLPVAIKVLNTEAARKPEIVVAFHHELRAVARLDHPAVAMVLDVGEIPEDAAAESDGQMVAGSPWFALEWAGAGTLHQPANQPDSWPQLERLLRRLLDGLAHAHARGVVHRDLKLQNLLVCAPEDPRPGPKIADFGIAFSSESLVLAGYESAGTANYMAPEQVRGDWRAFGPWTDLYAFGGVAWRLATGRPVFPGLAGTALLRAQLETEADAFVPRYPVPAGFEAWIRCCLRKDRRARFATAADATWGLALLGRASPAAPAPAVPAEADEAPTDTAAPLSSEAPTANPDRPPQSPFPTSWRSRSLPVAPLRLQKAGLKLLALRRPPFVGRATAFDVAWQALGRVVTDGRPQAIAIIGPSGVGRSRFAEAVAERAHEVGAAAVLAVDASRPGTLARLVAAATGATGLAPPDRARRIAQLTEATGGRDEALETALQGGTDAAAAAQLLDRLVAAERPLVLVLDDVQGDPEAAAFAHALLARGAPAVLVLLVADTAAGLPGEVTPIGPLPPAEMERLMGHVLRTDDRTTAIAEERASGSADRVFRLLAHWVAKGALHPRETGFSLDDDAADDIPDALREPWQSGVEALHRRHPDLRDDLEGVALAGGDLGLDDWLRLATPGRLRLTGARRRLELIDRLLRRGLARETPDLALANPGLVEVVCETARREGRDTAWHRAWAERFATSDPRRAGRHLLRAGDAAGAAERLEVAAAMAIEAREWRVALSALFALERALQLLPSATADRWCALFDGLAVCAYGLDRRELEQASLAALLAHALAAGLPSWEARARERTAHRAWLGRRLDDAREQAEAALRIREAIGDEAGVSGALSILAQVAEATGADPEGALHRQVLAIAMRRGDLTQAADTLRFMGARDGQRGQLVEAEDSLRRALALYPRAGPLGAGYASACNGLGEVLRGTGRVDEAVTWYREAVRMRRLRGNSALLPNLNLVTCHLAAGAIDEARRALAGCVEEARTSWDGEFDGLIHALASLCAAHAAEWDAYDLHVDRAQAALIASPHARQTDTADALDQAAGLARASGERERAAEARAVAVWVREHLREQ